MNDVKVVHLTEFRLGKPGHPVGFGMVAVTLGTVRFGLGRVWGRTCVNACPSGYFVFKRALEFNMAIRKIIIPDLETYDLYFAALLQAKGIRLLRTMRAGPRVIFVFEGSDEATALLAEWDAMSVEIVATSYVAALRNLKALLMRVLKSPPVLATAS